MLHIYFSWAIDSIVVMVVSLTVGGLAVNAPVGWGYVGHNLWARCTFGGGVRHGARLALSGWQSCRCLAACPDTPCGVQMAGWKWKDRQHTALKLMAEGTWREFVHSSSVEAHSLDFCVLVSRTFFLGGVLFCTPKVVYVGLSLLYFSCILLIAELPPLQLSFVFLAVWGGPPVTSESLIWA